MFTQEEFDKKYKEYQEYFSQRLSNFCEELNTVPEVLANSMKYSLLLGGKRLRPVLMYAVGDALNVDREILTPFAIALELIHTYSLIHDDLPEMDNDDFRRGKPSNHKVFGQANALLAGDGLLNTAYSVLLNECFKGSEYISAANFICKAAGIEGMIAGQSADLYHENDKTCDENVLKYIYENKTAKLITAAVTVPSVLKSGAHFSELKQFGKSFGYLFQLTDDILDVCGDFDKLGKSIGKDEKESKYTGVKIYGLDDCKLRVDLTADYCNTLLDGFLCNVDFLHALVDFVQHRVY